MIHFTQDCLSTFSADSTHDKKEFLTAGDAHAEYERYCSLYGVSEPFPSHVLGKTICSVLETKSVSSNSVRRYEGVYLAKPAQEAFKDGRKHLCGVEVGAEVKTQMDMKAWAGNSPVLQDVTNKITKMFGYINAHANQDITYEKYRQW
jgi:hypothetical protein